MDDNKRSINGCAGIVALAIIVLIIIIAVIVPLGSSYFATKTYTVTVTDKDIKNYNSSSKYLVFTKLEDGETRTFSIEDSLFKGRWDSSDTYAEIEIGETYKIEVIGWRIPFLSQYENIMTFSTSE